MPTIAKLTLNYYELTMRKAMLIVLLAPDVVQTCPCGRAADDDRNSIINYLLVCNRAPRWQRDRCKTLENNLSWQFPNVLQPNNVSACF